MERDNSWYTLIKLNTADSGKMTARVITRGDSPWFDGHFPDDPILPGIAQLNIVADLITAASARGMFMGGLSRVKFRKIVRPGELLDILAAKSNKKGQYTFRITSGNEEVCSGMMRFQQKSDQLIKNNKTTKTL